jgi:hypothetical protein
MPEGVGYGPQNTASVGKELNIIGNHAYAYSGSINASGSSSADVTMLDFSTGNEYIDASITISSTNSSSGNDEFFEIKINGQTVVLSQYTNGGDQTNDQPFRVLLPSYSTIEVLWGTAGDYNGTVILVGKIYK